MQGMQWVLDTGVASALYPFMLRLFQGQQKILTLVYQVQFVALHSEHAWPRSTLVKNIIGTTLPR